MATRPQLFPQWATSGAITQPTSGKQALGWLVAEKPAAQYDNWWKNIADGWLEYFDAIISSSIFGNGADGSATLDGTATVSWATKVGSVYTQTRDVALVDLTVTGGATLLMAGNRLVGQGTLTTSSGGKVNNDGGAGGAGGGGGPINGGTATAAGTLAAGKAGGAGGVSGGGTAGTNNIAPGGGAGGAGGNGAGGFSGAAGGTVSATGATVSSRDLLLATGELGYVWQLVAGTPTPLAAQGGASGGGGGGGAGGGGGGGGGGGPGVVAFRNLALANSNDVTCAGGAGGSVSASGGGGGGGGGGGQLWLIYYTKAAGLTFSSATNCAGGAGGTGNGTGVNGTPGSTGVLHEFALGLPTASGIAPSSHVERGVITMATGGSGAGFDFGVASFSSNFSALPGVGGGYMPQVTLTPTDGAPSAPAYKITFALNQMTITPVEQFNGIISWRAET